MTIDKARWTSKDKEVTAIWDEEHVSFIQGYWDSRQQVTVTREEFEQMYKAMKIQEAIGG